MLRQSYLPLFLWAEVVSTICYMQNRSIIHRRCFVLNDKENLNKFSPKADEGIFIGYSQTSAAYKVYLNKSKIVVESVNVTFDEELSFEQNSSEPVLTGVLASGQISPELAVNVLGSNKASEELNDNQPITSEVSSESAIPIQDEIQVQTPTPSVEVVHVNEELEVSKSVGSTATTTHQTENVQLT
ncbi:hypothetical protein L6452_14713 [Arctium lappa]|uniref:Uncharacterized protein n=1 Tax=Arctium lappa TaxID=4217 RepID=A0ACB9CM95_ARCLA|nr:hypothetical protein L6452_14713 [Arctium lappa]